MVDFREYTPMKGNTIITAAVVATAAPHTDQHVAEAIKCTFAFGKIELQTPL